MKDSQEEGKLVDALKIFSQDFGPDDVYNRIIVEEILKELLNIKDKEETDGRQKN
jgi:hypothetical protein